MNSGLKTLVFFLSLATTTAFAFQPIPKESAKALKVTRGKPFSAGAVFINGKYIEPPYVVERWGTGIRINAIPVTGQIIDWNEFLKTQPNVKIEKREVESASEQPAAAVSVADEMSSLDDLFDDDSKPKKVTAKPVVTSATPKSAKKTAPSATPKTVKTVVAYRLDGEFEPNDGSKALVARINATRTEIDKTLRAGGFICFGDAYSMVQGDRRTFMELLERLPELQQKSPDVQSFCVGLRDARLVYLNEVLRWELFRNRTDYLKLKERREKLKSDQKWDQILEEASDPLF